MNAVESCKVKYIVGLQTAVVRLRGCVAPVLVSSFSTFCTLCDGIIPVIYIFFIHGFNNVRNSSKS
jgi:hypothetical protein